jgi:hypothetical protein
LEERIDENPSKEDENDRQRKKTGKLRLSGMFETAFVRKA